MLMPLLLLNAMTITIDELTAITISIVELIAITRLSRDTYILYKVQLPQHLVSVALELSTRKVVLVSPVYC